MIQRWTRFALWAGVGECALILAWPWLFPRRFPLPAGEFAEWPQPLPAAILVFSLCTAVWLSVPRWHTRERLLVSAWIMGPIGVLLVLLGSGAGLVGLAMTWAFIDIRAKPAGPEREPGGIVTGEPIACLECGEPMPGNAVRCEKCGWSFVAS